MVRLRIACSFSLITLLLAATWSTASSTAQTGETVLLDFSSPSCGPCQQMQPTLQQLIGAGYPIREVDVIQERELAEQYGITQVPAFVLLVDGKEFARTIGPTSYRQLERMFLTAGINPADPIATIELANAGATPSTFASQPQMGRIVPIQQATAQQPTGLQIQPSPRNGQMRAAQGSVSNAQLLESTVRITVQDPQGNSTGTGTIVDARSGEALVLTCGHLFRSSGGQGAITVTQFQVVSDGAASTKTGSHRVQVRSTLKGRLVDYDLQRDLGLVSFRTSEQVRVATIPPLGTKLTPNLPVTTLGCNHGQNPTVIATHITTVGRYLGPPNVEVAGAPVEGRSGGGLFNADGQLVGVCFAADPQDSEGLFSSLESIHAKLDSLNLTMIYQPASSANQPKTVQPKTNQPNSIQSSIQAPIQPNSNAAQLATAPTQQPFAVRGQQPAAATPSFPAAIPTPIVSPNPPSTLLATGLTNNSSLSAAEQATLEEIVRRGENSEIICIIRPKTPDGKSEVITLSNASANFVRALTSPSLPQAATLPPVSSPR